MCTQWLWQGHIYSNIQFPQHSDVLALIEIAVFLQGWGWSGEGTGTQTNALSLVPEAGVIFILSKKVRPPRRWWFWNLSFCVLMWLSCERKFPPANLGISAFSLLRLWFSSNHTHTAWNCPQLEASCQEIGKHNKEKSVAFFMNCLGLK